MERFTPLYAIAHAIMNGIENLRFGKEGYFHVLVFYIDYIIKEIENIPLQFLVLPNFHSCFYNCMETRKTFSIS